jgi:hypothetical protein
VCCTSQALGSVTHQCGPDRKRESTGLQAPGTIVRCGKITVSLPDLEVGASDLEGVLPPRSVRQLDEAADRVHEAHLLDRLAVGVEEAGGTQRDLARAPRWGYRGAHTLLHRSTHFTRAQADV